MKWTFFSFDDMAIYEQGCFPVVMLYEKVGVREIFYNARIYTSICVIVATWNALFF